jgi:hypothetical protein
VTELLETTNKEQTNKEYVVRDNWFKGYMEGNVLIPQVLNILGFTTMAAVLKDPPQKWEEFFHSWFNDEQIKDQGRIMTMQHRAKGINVTDKHHANSEAKVVSEGRLHSLWMVAKNYTLIGLLSYIRYVKTGEPEQEYNTADQEKYYEEVNNFFNDPINSEKVQKLKDIIGATRDGFNTKRGIQLAKLYRAPFDQRPTQSGNIELDDASFDLAEELPSLYPGIELQSAARKEFSKQAREFALKEVPAFIGNQWYNNLRF